MSTITTVVFDFGNVLIGWDPRRVWRSHLTEDEIERFLSEADFAGLNARLDAGTPFVDVRADLAARTPHHVATLETYWQSFARSLTGSIPGTAELVAELHGLGVRMLGLTNWSAETYHHAATVAPVVKLLDDVVVSGHEGLAKPDPAIFRLLIERHSLAPSGTLFVDDSPANVDAARSVGLLAHRFTDVSGLRAELRRLGIDVAVPATPRHAPGGVSPDVDPDRRPSP